MNSKSEYIYSKLPEISKMISENKPLLEISRNLGVKNDTLKKYLKILGLEYKGNQGRKGLEYKGKKTNLEEYFSGEKTIQASSLRYRLIRDGYKDEVCECCGLSEWMGKKIPLELHHKDGNHYNNSLDNLQILCSNCHMQAHNYSNLSLKK